MIISRGRHEECSPCKQATGYFRDARLFYRTLSRRSKHKGCLTVENGCRHGNPTKAKELTMSTRRAPNLVTEIGSGYVEEPAYLSGENSTSRDKISHSSGREPYGWRKSYT